MGDSLSDLLATVAVKQFACRRVQLGGSWTMRTAPSDWVRFCTLVRGEISVETRERRRGWHLRAGETIIFTRGTGHAISGGSGAPVLLETDNRLETESVAPLLTSDHYGEEPRRDEILVGGYLLHPEGSLPILRLLPDVMLLPLGDGPKELQLLNVWHDAMNSEDAGLAGVRRHVASACFARLISKFISSQPEMAWMTAGGVKSGMATALSTMHRRPQESWTVDRLSRLAAMSRSSFYTAFSEMLGEPPMKYLSNLRMARAAEVLSNPRVSVNAAAAAAGYATTVAFLRSFKRRYGMTPGDYRRMQRAMPQNELS